MGGKDQLTVVDGDDVVSFGQTARERGLRVVDASMQLAEGGQRGRAHPHDQVLVLVAVVGADGAEVPDVPLPVERPSDARPRGRVLELDVAVSGPSDARLQETHRDGGRRGGRAVVGERERVIEQRVGDGAARADLVRAGEGVRRALAAQRRDRVAQQLVVVARLDVATVVLVEVLEAVVEIDGRREVVLQQDRDVAHARRVEVGHR